MLHHDVHTVYTFQKTLTCENGSTANKESDIFIDGCSGKCKNYKNLTNLLHHYCDYALYAE